MRRCSCAQDEQHLRGEPWPDVDGADVRPVEDELGDPVLTRQGTRGLLSCRDLRHVHQRRDPGIPRCGGHDSRRLHQASGVRRIAEVGPLDALHRVSHPRKVEEVSEHDLRIQPFGAKISKTPRRVPAARGIPYLSWDAGILLVRWGRALRPRLRSAGDPEVREFEPRSLNWSRLVEFLREVGRLAEEGALAA